MKAENISLDCRAAPQPCALRINVPDLAFAAFLVALGALAFALAGELSVGTAAAMGPGYVPRGLAILIMVYGAVLGLRAAFTGTAGVSGHRVAPAAADLGVRSRCSPSCCRSPGSR